MQAHLKPQPLPSTIKKQGKKPALIRNKEESCDHSEIKLNHVSKKLQRQKVRQRLHCETTIIHKAHMTVILKLS